MKKITKAQTNQFRKDALRILEDIGAKETTTVFKELYEHTVQTKYGPLLISIDSSQGAVYTIYTRFEDPKRIPPALFPKPNRYSGKWNFHEYSADECLSTFEKVINAVKQ